MPTNILKITNRCDFRQWLAEHPDEKECWLAVKRGRPSDPAVFYYLDAVEEALCFGWIDSTVKEIDGVRMQRFSPRQKNSPWTELNKARVRRLERLGLMTDRGRAVLPPMGKRSFQIDPEIVQTLKAARVWTKFRSFPPLYQRVRAYNVAFCKRHDPAAYEKALSHLIEATRKGQTFGEWNDYGRLLEVEESQMNVRELLPKDKHDRSTVPQLLALTDAEIAPILPELLTWLQDLNWPIAGEIAAVIARHAALAEPLILDVLHGSDEVWKYNLLSYLLPTWKRAPQNEALRAEIARIANHPTETEIADKVDQAAAEYLASWP